MLKRFLPASLPGFQKPAVSDEKVDFEFDETTDNESVIISRKPLNVKPEPCTPEISLDVPARVFSQPCAPTPTPEPESPVDARVLPQPPYDYSYYIGVMQGTLWAILGSTFNLPTLMPFFGAFVFSGALAERLGRNEEIDPAGLSPEQEQMIFQAAVAALETSSLELLLANNPIGFWAAPLIMVSANMALPIIEKKLVAKNPASWWNRRPANSVDNKKTDVPEETVNRFTRP